MSVYVGNSNPRGIYLGVAPVRGIYVGNELIWPPDTDPTPTPEYDFYDDFERSTLGPDWEGTGALIDAGTLKKSTSAGNSRNWIAQTFDSDDLEIITTIGTTQDDQQLGEILIGSGLPNDDYVRLLFSKQSMRADTWTGAFNTVATLPAQPLNDGDTVGLSRQGDTFTVTYNGNTLGTFTSSVAKGPEYRRVALAVNMALVFIARFYGPTFDDIGVIAH